MDFAQATKHLIYPPSTARALWDLAAGPSPTAVVHRVDGKVLIRNVSFPAPREQAAMGLQQIGVIFPSEP